jgi:hypothetical protein
VPIHLESAQLDHSRKQFAHYGLDLVNGKVVNNLEVPARPKWVPGLGSVDEKEMQSQAGVLEPAMSKIKGIQFATEAAITVRHSVATGPRVASTYICMSP